MFNDHCRANNYSKYRYNPDFYMGPFAQHGITVLQKETRVYHGSRKTCTFYTGVDLAANIAMEQYDDL